MVGGVKVARDLHESDALLEGVLSRSLREARVLKDSQRDLLHVGAVVSGVDRRHAVGVCRRHERVPEPQHHQATARARRGAIDSVVSLGGRILRATGTMVLSRRIARGVERIIVVVEEVPARDVVNIGVAISVRAV